VYVNDNQDENSTKMITWVITTRLKGRLKLPDKIEICLVSEFSCVGLLYYYLCIYCLLYYLYMFVLNCLVVVLLNVGFECTRFDRLFARLSLLAHLLCSCE